MLTFPSGKILLGGNQARSMKLLGVSYTPAVHLEDMSGEPALRLRFLRNPFQLCNPLENALNKVQLVRG